MNHTVTCVSTVVAPAYDFASLYQHTNNSCFSRLRAMAGLAGSIIVIDLVKLEADASRVVGRSILA